MIQPTWHGPLVNPDGTLSKPLIDLLRALASGTSSAATATDLSAVEDRLDALESGSGGSSVALYAGPNITITGSAEAGYTITAATGDPLAAQIFGK
jgi:hypothetical protein